MPTRSHLDSCWHQPWSLGLSWNHPTAGLCCLLRGISSAVKWVQDTSLYAKAHVRAPTAHRSQVWPALVAAPAAARVLRAVAAMGGPLVPRVDTVCVCSGPAGDYGRRVVLFLMTSLTPAVSHAWDDQPFEQQTPFVLNVICTGSLPLENELMAFVHRARSEQGG